MGPLETFLRSGGWNEYLKDDDRAIRDAIVLDLAGCTKDDMSGAMESLISAYRVKDEWNYYTACIRSRIADRELVEREVRRRMQEKDD